LPPNIPDVETVVCPNCGEAATSEDFTCPQCAVILNAAALECEPVSLVEALLSPTNATAARSGDAGNSRGNELTVRATILMDEFTVPRLLVGVDLALKPLHPFEAYVASFVDGRHSVPEIANAAEISRLEAMAILQTLAFRDVVELNRDEDRAPGGADVPELDAEPKTDVDGLSADEVEQARQLAGEEADALAVDPGVREGHPAAAEPESSRPTLPVFDPEALHAQLLAAAEAQLTSAAVAFAARPAGPAAPGTRSRGVAPMPSAPQAATGTPSRGLASMPSAAPAVAGTPSRGVAAPPSAPRAKTLLLQDRPTPFQREQSVEYTLERAIAMERRGDLEGAIYILKKAIAQSSNAAPLYNKLALALVRRKEFSEAVPLLERAVAIAPDDTTYQQNLYKVMGLAAASGGATSGGKGGVLSRLLGRK